MKIHVSGNSEEQKDIMHVYYLLKNHFPKSRVHTKNESGTNRYHIYLTTKPPQEPKKGAIDYGKESSTGSRFHP